MKQLVNAKNAPAAIGPYSHAIKAGNLVFVSGQLPINPENGTMPETIEEQTEQSLKNVSVILAEAGCSMNDVVKSTVFLADMSLFGAMNEVYAKWFDAPFPARCAFAVKELPKKALVEIEVIASCEK